MTGVNNWEVMLGRLASGQKEIGSKGWFSWGWSKAGDKTEMEEDRTRLDALKDKIAMEKMGLQTQASSTAAMGGWAR